MNWKNTKLIFLRELNDQWRDRRTIFTILVMPMVLYPLMGMALMQTAQFMNQSPPRVLVVGQDLLPADPPLFTQNELSPTLHSSKTGSPLILTFENSLNPETSEQLSLVFQEEDSDKRNLLLERFLKQYGFDLLVTARGSPESPKTSLQIFANSTSDQSAVAATIVSGALDRWKGQQLKKRLKELDIKEESVSSLSVASFDIASKDRRKAATWAKLLPFIVLVWALTGAFYPAIDVCAGEKERGTLETLLSSPARRSEIVTGKLLTVASFSFATAILNLVSMVATGILVIGQLGKQGGLPLDIGFPPITSLPWLVLGMIPVVALFSSLALALAAFAKSSKEGQYYLVPLLMSLIPLMMLSMLPTAKLDMGTSLIPVTGMLLLIKNLMLGEYQLAMQFVGPVLAITLVCCWMSTRWAVFQFNNESVLFRSGEKFGLGSWLRHVVRDRGPLPSFGEAILCGVIILVIKFFVGLSAQLDLTFSGFAKQVTISQIATIALPAILMALFLTRGPRETLKLKMPRLSFVPACILIAILLHPGFILLSNVVMFLYPASAGLDQIQVAVSTILADAPSTFAILCVIALVPAVCEEVAFRGFILSGLQTLRGKWSAIVISAAFFGIAHGILQQSIMASFVGVVLGIIAVQTGSLLPCIAYHLTHNSLPVLMSVFPTHSIDTTYMGYVLQTNATGGIEYTLAASIAMPVLGLGLLFWLWKFADQRSPQPEYLLGPTGAATLSN